MASFTIYLVVVLLVLGLAASYASAATLQDVCKKSDFPDYCVTLLKPTIMGTTTDFNSPTWKVAVRGKFQEKAEAVEHSLVTYLEKASGSELKALKSCIIWVQDGVKLIKKGDVKTALNNMHSCDDADDPLTREIKDLVTQAYQAGQVVLDVGAGNKN